MAESKVRPAQADDAQAMAEIFAAVAEERTGIATEPPVDLAECASLFAASASGSIGALRMAGRSMDRPFTIRHCCVGRSWEAGDWSGDCAWHGLGLCWLPVPAGSDLGRGSLVPALWPVLP
jgi:hypothetical protein